MAKLEMRNNVKICRKGKQWPVLNGKSIREMAIKFGSSAWHDGGIN